TPIPSRRICPPNRCAELPAKVSPRPFLSWELGCSLLEKVYHRVTHTEQTVSRWIATHIHASPASRYNFWFMIRRARTRVRVVCLLSISLVAQWVAGQAGGSWQGSVVDDAGKPVTAAIVKLHSASASGDYTAGTDSSGAFKFEPIPAGTYQLSVTNGG